MRCFCCFAYFCHAKRLTRRISHWDHRCQLCWVKNLNSRNSTLLASYPGKKSAPIKTVFHSTFMFLVRFIDALTISCCLAIYTPWMPPFIVTWDFFDWGVFPSRQSGNIIWNHSTMWLFSLFANGFCVNAVFHINKKTNKISIMFHCLNIENGSRLSLFYFSRIKITKELWMYHVNEVVTKKKLKFFYHTVVLVSSIICRRLIPLGPLMLSWCWIEISICKHTFVWFCKFEKKSLVSVSDLVRYCSET